MPGSPATAPMSRRVRSSRVVLPELRCELESGVPWSYPWRFGPGDTAPVHSDGMVGMQESRRQMIEGHVREALAAAGPQASVLDLHCGEGWFSHLALDWGAARVLGIDAQQLNVRRARLVADEFGVPAERLRFERADVRELRADELGTFDVVLNLSPSGQLEDPVGAMLLAAAVCRSLCVVDTCLTLRQEPLVPDARAVEQMAKEAGFSGLERLEPPLLADSAYISGRRGVFVARVGSSGS